MSDLVLNNQGDLEVIQSSSAVNTPSRTEDAIYDLSTSEDFITDLIIKAVKTPRGNITISVPEADSITLLDINFGSNIYRELSEGITLNFLSRVKSHIIDTLRAANLLVNVIDMTVGMVDSYTIQLNIIYGDNTPSTFIRLTV